MESCAHVAQLAEHVLGKDEVMRSIRVVGSIRRSVARCVYRGFFCNDHHNHGVGSIVCVVAMETQLDLR